MSNQIMIMSVTPTQLTEMIIQGVKQEIEKLYQVEKQPLQEDRLLTIQQACEYLQCSKTTFWRVSKQGLIKTLKRGRNRLVKVSELENYLNSQNS